MYFFAMIEISFFLTYLDIKSETLVEILAHFAK